MQNEFKIWLSKQSYTPNTCEDYYKRLERLIKNQKYISWEELAKNIVKILPDYEKGGKLHNNVAKISHSSNLAAVRCYNKFVATIAQN